MRIHSIVVALALGCPSLVGCASTQPGPEPTATAMTNGSSDAAGTATSTASIVPLEPLPPAETFAAAANPPEVHLTLVVGKRVFVLPLEHAARKPKAPLGKAAQVSVAHGIAAPAWVVDPAPVASPAPYTFVRVDGSCIDPGRERLLVGIARDGGQSPSDAEWFDAVELKRCALKTAPAAGGVFWDRFAVAGEHQNARFAEPMSIEGAARERAHRLLKEHLATDQAHAALKESVVDAPVYGFEGEAGVIVVETQVDIEKIMALKVSKVLRVIQGEKVIATVRDASVSGLLVLGERRFLAVGVDQPAREQSATSKLFEIVAGRVLDAGEIKVPADRPERSGG